MVKVADRHTDFTLSGRGTKMIPMSRPRLAVDTRGKGIYYIYRDVDRNSRVTVAYSGDLSKGNWNVSDLTDFRLMHGNQVMIQICGTRGECCIFLYNVPHRETERR